MMEALMRNSCILMAGSIVGWIVWSDIVPLHAKQFRDYSLHWNAIYSPFWKILIMLLNTFRLLFNFEITRCNLPALKKVTQIWILQCRMILWTWWWWIWWEDWVKFITRHTLHLGQAMKIEVLEKGKGVTFKGLFACREKMAIVLWYWIG